MSCACTPILVGMASLVLEILLLSKMAKFPFLTMDYSPWSSKNSIDRYWLKKFMQKGLMSSACTPILVGVASPVSEILLLSKTAKFPFPTMDYSPWSSKNSIDRYWLKKFMQKGLMSSACTPILVGVASPVLEILLLSKMAKFPFLSMDYGHQKIQSIGIGSKNSCK